MEHSESERELRLNEAFAEYLRRVDRDEAVDRAGFAEQFPEFADDLAELLQTAERVHHMAGPRRSDEEKDKTEAETRAADVLAETSAFKPGERGSVRADAHDAGPKDSLVGCSFGDHEILSVIGRGGMGVVYKARQISLDRIVAVKMIRAGVLASESDVKRFRTEARAAGKLGHPNIVRVHQVGEIEGRHFYTMEYIEGSDLAKLIRSGPLSPERAARYVKGVAEGTHHVHEQGVIHRDLKPANVIVDSNDCPKVGDFGLAKEVQRDKGLTESGTSLGTPSYMSPEQAGAKLDEIAATSDIYSLGAVLYELLTGRPPFRADSTVDTLLEVIHNEPAAPRSLNPRLDRRIEAVCLKCLNKDPVRRYSTARELAEDLGRYLDGDPVRARPVGRVLQCWHWLRDVPLVAAVVGRRVASPTRTHKLAQWIAVALAAFLILASVTALWNRGGERPFPTRVRIASGSRLGEYYHFAQSLGARLQERLDVPVES